LVHTKPVKDKTRLDKVTQEKPYRLQMALSGMADGDTNTLQEQMCLILTMCGALDYVMVKMVIARLDRCQVLMSRF